MQRIKNTWKSLFFWQNARAVYSAVVVKIAGTGADCIDCIVGLYPPGPRLANIGRVAA